MPTRVKGKAGRIEAWGIAVSYEEALSILERIKAGDKSPTVKEITEALILTGDIDA